MEYFTSVVGIMIAALFTNNIVLNQTIGVCPFLGVSKKLNSSVGMGIAVIFVIVISSMVSYVLYRFVLEPLNFQYLRLIVFILVIASLVQMLEILLRRFTPSLYNSMGIYLPLITTNCAVLFTANYVVDAADMDLFKVFIHALFVGLGFMLALILMGGAREKLERSQVPKPVQGFPIALITAGLLSLAFIGLGTLSLFK